MRVLYNLHAKNIINLCYNLIVLIEYKSNTIHMGFTRALYYPTIDITNEEWLKTAILFWDEINTIVPSSISKPYREPSTQYLEDEGLLKPFWVDSDRSFITELTSDTIDYLSTNEGFQLLTQTENDLYYLHREKLPMEINHLFKIHAQKLPREIQRELNHKITTDGWVNVDSNFASFYMTLLANKICDRHSIALLTDDVLTSSLTDKIRLDNQISLRDRRYYDDRDIQKHINIAQGMLTNLVIENVKIGASSIDDVVKFKRKYKDELGLFRTNIGKITNNVSEDKPLEAIKQEVADVYINEFLPSYNNFKKALNGASIKWTSDNFMKISLISTGATALPMAVFGLALPQALLAGAGISLISSLISYNVERRNLLSTNPYSYLLAVEKKLNRS